MAFLKPEDARSILESTHMIVYQGITGNIYFGRGITFLFFFAILACLCVFILLLANKNKYYFVSLVSCGVLAGGLTAADLSRVTLRLPGGGEALLARAGQAMRGLNIVGKNVMRTLNDGKSMEGEMQGDSEDNARQGIIAHAFVKFFGFTETTAFTRLPESLRAEIQAALLPHMDIQPRPGAGTRVVLAYRYEPEDVKAALETMGYRAAAQQVKMDIIKNATSLKADEARMRLMFVLSKASRYYVGDKFYSAPENLQREFEGMELMLEGTEPRHLFVRSIQRISETSIVFTVDVL